MLALENVCAAYAAAPVLSDVCMQVHPGDFAAIVGPNGAGKSSLLRAISGTLRARSGAIRFLQHDLLRTAASRRAHLGIAHVPEGRQVFASLSVFENLEMGAYVPAGRAAFARNLERIYSWFPVLAQRAKSPAGELSGGQQQMLAIARGLASEPKLLMLDEPSVGLAPAVADEIFERIAAIHASTDLTVILVEQRVVEALHYARSGFVLEGGRIVLQAEPEQLMRDDRVRLAYLGA